MGVGQMAGLEIENLSYAYPGQDRLALDKISLSISRGDIAVLAGPSGSGKSTLAKAVAGLVPSFYGGRFQGCLSWSGQSLAATEPGEKARTIGYLSQDPESQLLTETVLSELVFGMENLGWSQKAMSKQVMEVASALALTEILEQPIRTLSGGLKQRVALGSILAMEPALLVLDEPTSQLDPVATEELLALLRRLNEDQGMTILLAEHRLDRCFHWADQIIYMDEGKVVYQGKDLREAARWAACQSAMPLPPMPRLFAGFGPDLPLTVKEGRRHLAAQHLSEKFLQPEVKGSPPVEEGVSPLLELEGVWYSYEPGLEGLRNLQVRISPGDFLAVMGENGAGKSTFLKLCRGLLQADRGRIRYKGQDMKKLSVEALAGTIGYLGQEPGEWLFMPTVKEEVAFTLKALEREWKIETEACLEDFQLQDWSQRNPRDLSVGQRQKVALASVAAAGPPLLLLDEPTRGLDEGEKEALGHRLQKWQRQGMAIVMVTHDVEFAAEHAGEVAFLSRGSWIDRGPREAMLSGSTFYAPQTAKLFRGLAEHVVTLSRGRELLGELNKEEMKRGEDHE